MSQSNVIKLLLGAIVAFTVSACATASGPAVPGTKPVPATPNTADAVPQGRDANERYIFSVLTTGQQAFEASRTALTKGRTTIITTAADSEMAEQQQLARTLRQLLPTGTAIPALSATQQQQLVTLGQTSGRAFDRAYSSFMLHNHDAQQALHDTCLTACTSPELQRIAGLARSQTRDHLRLLTLFQRSL